jgi:hypothetical protein
MVITGWRAAVVLVIGLLLIALLVTALFWVAILLAALGAVAWFNMRLLPDIARRVRVRELVLAAALLPVLALAGLALAGSSGIIAGCSVWLVGVALPRGLLRYMLRRAERQRQANLDARLHPVRIIDIPHTPRS